MTSIALRKELQQYISHADERFLRMVHSLAKEYARKDSQTIGYKIGKSISKKQLYSDLKEAEIEIEEGKYFTIDELDKESEKW